VRKADNLPPSYAVVTKSACNGTALPYKGESTASRAGRFTAREEPGYPLSKRLGGPQSRF